jgi:hypothetical protein
MVTALMNTGKRLDLMAICFLLLFYVIVFTVNKRNESVINEWLRAKKNNVISCTPGRSVNGLNSLPTNDNNGTGCMHQPVVAALPGKNRVKRNTIHNC